MRVILTISNLAKRANTAIQSQLHRTVPAFLTSQPQLTTSGLERNARTTSLVTMVNAKMGIVKVSSVPSHVLFMMNVTLG
jgi:hypothetical protein